MFHPEFQRLIHRVLERFASVFHRHHFCAKTLHQKNVGPLALDIFAPHKDDAVQAQFGGDGGRGNAVLACTRFRYQHFLSEALREESLPQTVRYLVRAGVIRALILEIHFCSTEVRRCAFSKY